MLEARSREGGSLSAGLLAERMVLTLGRVLRGEDLKDSERAVLRDSHELFAAMTSHDVFVVSPSASRMLDEGSYFDALQVVERQAADHPLEELLDRYTGVLAKLGAGDALADERERATVESLRSLFVIVGERSLARAYEASRAPEEVTWRLTKQASLHF
jgi:hypothetical protein